MSCPIEKVSVLNLDQYAEIIDVRSPAEFAEDHIPGAINLYVLDDEQRKEVGTLYKQVSPFEAKKRGAALISRNIAHWLDTHFAHKDKRYRPLVYCWRGGQRSLGMATILSRIDWRTDLVEGGYKHYRHQVRDTLEEASDLKLVVVAGLTGTAKTVILKTLEALGEQVIDLEGLANHRGSLLGHQPHQPQPSQKYFESLLVKKVSSLSKNRITWIEAESNKIGQVHCPEALWKNMRKSPTVHVEAPLESRIKHLLGEYQFFTQEAASLKAKLAFLTVLRGEALVQKWYRQIDNGHWEEFVTSMLDEHYDLSYSRSIKRDERPNLGTFSWESLEEAQIDRLANEMIQTIHYPEQ